MTKFTPTEKKILELLMDGQGHTKREIFDKCIPDELARLSAVNNHLLNLRKKLAPGGQGIQNEQLNGKSVFRLVRFMASPNNE